MTIAIVFAVSACGNNLEENDTTDNTSEASTLTTIEEIEPVSVEEAVQAFKADPYSEVEGYDLSDNGWLSKDREGYVGNIHTLGLENADDIECLESYRSYAYSLDNNLLTKYSFGEIVATSLIPDKSIYCGISEGNGFIFRNGDSVFCISLDLTETKTVATGVKMVLDTNYQYSHDAWSQPLLLMENGSIKAYVQWEKELKDPLYEGGFGGTMFETF